MDIVRISLVETLIYARQRRHPMEPVLVLVLAIGLLIATYRDVQERLVPDTASMGLIALGLLAGIVQALLAHDASLFLPHLVGFLAGLALGLLMYVTRQWGGGDAKLLAGVGAVMGLWTDNLLLPAFLVLLILAGAVYGLCMTLYLALVKHRKSFLPAFVAYLRTRVAHRLRITLVVTCALLLALMLFVDVGMRILLGGIMVALYLLLYSWILMRVVETTVLTKKYPVGKLVEGDWLAQDVVVRKKTVAPMRKIGVTLSDIAALRKAKVRSVVVREGIAFVPAFLIAFVLLIIIERSWGIVTLVSLF
jgi:Flp pilus assembly protein protease CpaA